MSQYLLSWVLIANLVLHLNISLIEVLLPLVRQFLLPHPLVLMVERCVYVEREALLFLLVAESECKHGNRVNLLIGSKYICIGNICLFMLTGPAFPRYASH